MHSARSRIRLVTALISGAALAAGTLGTAGAASAAAGPNRPGAPTVPASPTYAFGSGATSVFGETWNAADHQSSKVTETHLSACRIGTGKTSQ